MFVLINFLVSIGFAVIGWLIHLYFLRAIYALAVLVPSLAVGARRLHDTGRSGWWQLLFLIPVIGWIVLLIFFVVEGTPGDNEYGTNPRSAGGGGAVPEQDTQTP